MKLPKQLVQAILTAIETFTVYLILIIPVELLLTEKLLITPVINNQTKTIIFGAIFLIIFSFNFFNSKFSASIKKTASLILLFFVVSLFVNHAYQGYYGRLQNQPKIYSISSPWGIQDMRIDIRGKNFAPAWQEGKIYVDNLRLRSEKWTENEVIAVLPVPPRHFKGKIYIVDNKGAESNTLPFTIKNPDFLKN